MHDKRSGFDITDDELKNIDEVISPLIKNGLSLYAALQTEKDEIHISESTLYRLIAARAITACNLDLHEKVSRKIPTKQRKSNDAYAVLTAEKLGHLFFCESNRSDEKGSCERNHREMRKIILKKIISFQDFNQNDITLMMNHVNSYPGGSLGDKCPYDVSIAILPEDFFILLGLEKIPTKEGIMKPKLLQDRVLARKKIA